MKLLKFYAGYCQPCKVLSKTLSEKFSEHPLVKTMENIDIEADFKTASTFRVRSLPTLVIIDENGGELRRLVSCGGDALVEFLG